MMRRALVIVLAVLIASFRLWRRPRRPARIVDVSNAVRSRGGDGKAICDAQAAWMREQSLIAADSVVRAVQLARAEIAHVGAAEARAVLDGLQNLANEHPEGVPGHLVADARTRFDASMRMILQ